jgi:hypothetical protein
MSEQDSSDTCIVTHIIESLNESQCQYICNSTAETKRPAKYREFYTQMDNFPRRQVVKMPKIIEVYNVIILLLIL